MSFGSVAAQLYTIKSRKNVNFSTAFGMMVREEVAARLSVYNLVRAATGSTLLATVLQAKYGKKTPLEREEEKEANKRAEADKRFKMFTASSIANLTKRISLVEDLTKRNTAMVLNLYNEIGQSRTRRRMNPSNIRNLSAVRIPLSSRTVVGQIDELKEQIKKLEEARKAKPKILKKKEKKEKKEEEKGGIPFSLLNILFGGNNLIKLAGVVAPLVATALGGSMTAIGMGAINRTIQRLTGKKNIEGDNEISRALDPYLAGAGAFGATIAGYGAYKIGKGVFNIGRMGIDILREKSTARAATAARNAIPESALVDKNGRPLKGAARELRIRKILRERGLAPQTAPSGGSRTTRPPSTSERISSDRIRRIREITEQATKFQKFAQHALRVAKIIAPFKIAGVAYDLSLMSSAMSDYADGKIGYADYKKIMSERYGVITESIGITAISAAVGGAVGFAFGGIGAIPGLIVGIGAGLALDAVLDDDDMSSIGTFIFETIHEEQRRPVTRPAGSAARTPTQVSTSTTTPATTAAGRQPAATTVNELPIDTTGTGSQGVAELAISAIGLTENDPALKKFLAAGGVTVNDPKFEAWCASFVNSILNRKGYIGTGSKVANSFQNWGVKINSFAQIKPGDIVLETNDKPATSTGGHVGIATGVFDSARGMIEIIAGNTNNKVEKYFIPADSDVMIRRATSSTVTAATTPSTGTGVATPTAAAATTSAESTATATPTPAATPAAVAAINTIPDAAAAEETNQQSSEESTMLASNMESTAIAAHAATIAVQQIASVLPGLKAEINATKVLALNSEFPSTSDPNINQFSVLNKMIATK